MPILRDPGVKEKETRLSPRFRGSTIIDCRGASGQNDLRTVINSSLPTGRAFLFRLLFLHAQHAYRVINNRE